MTTLMLPEDSRSGNGKGRMVIFFLSPRVIDFDTYLPVAMEMKAARPDWDIRFVTFSRQNFDFIGNNPTLVEGLRRCGQLRLFSSDGASGFFSRFLRRLCGLWVLLFWIVRRPRPILFQARPFSQAPYNLFYLFSRLRGGVAFLLNKSRSPDVVHHIVWQNREKPEHQKRSLLNRLLGRDIDGLIYYHDEQKENVSLCERFGRIDNVPWCKIGMPHFLAQWRAFIDDEVRQARRQLEQEGVSAETEIYTIFAAKPYSAVNLRSSTSVEEVFTLCLEALREHRPDALVFIRPHPLAIDAEHIRQGIASVGADFARISFLHPEVLVSLSRLVFLDNPSNLMFSCFPGRFVDCSDYPESHYEQFGEVSLAHGYGPLYLNPRSSGFSSRILEIINKPELCSSPDLTTKRDNLLSKSKPGLEPLFELVGDDNKE